LGGWRWKGAGDDTGEDIGVDVKKTEKTPRREIDLAISRAKVKKTTEK
jgi:hypothetical protein